MIYLLALSGLFCFFLLLQVAFVLAKSQVTSPNLAILLPWAAIFCIALRDYMRVLSGRL